MLLLRVESSNEPERRLVWFKLNICSIGQKNEIESGGTEAVGIGIEEARVLNNNLARDAVCYLCLISSAKG